MILLYEKSSVVKCTDMESKAVFGRLGSEGNWEALFYQFCKMKSVEEVSGGWVWTYCTACECPELYS